MTMRAATLLLILLLFTRCQANNGQAHADAMIDIVSTEGNLMDGGGVGVGVEPTIIRARKMGMATNKVRKKESHEVKEAVVGSSKISTGNHRVVGNLINQDHQDGKEAMNAARKGRVVVKDINKKEAAFVAFSADYHAPRHHPPRHN